MKKIKILTVFSFMLLSISFLLSGKNSIKAEAKTGYELYVNIAENCVTAYLDGNPVYAMPCSTGTATPSAGSTFTLGQKYRWKELDGKVYGQYCSRISSNILFHSVPQSQSGVPNSVISRYYDRLGTRASAGCIRLMVRDAKWIYDNCPSGSTKVIFYSQSGNPGPLGKPQTYKISDVPAAFANWDPTDPDPNNPWSPSSVYFKDVFDVNFYRESNPDLAGLDDTALRMHWIKVGKAAGLPGKAGELTDLLNDDIRKIFDPDYYRDNNPDVVAVYGARPVNLFKHYFLYGLREGRQGSPNFDAKTYKNNYPDLQAAYGNDLFFYAAHYVEYGAAEWRLAAIDISGIEKVFDINYYVSNNPDLVSAFGTKNLQIYVTHFVLSGANEGRQSKDDFSVLKYKENNPDLQAAFGNNGYAYVRHYLDYGMKEGRIAI